MSVFRIVIDSNSITRDPDDEALAIQFNREILELKEEVRKAVYRWRSENNIDDTMQVRIMFDSDYY